MRSIRGRLVLTLGLGVAIVLLGGGAGVFVIVQDSMLAQLQSELEARAEGLASQAVFDDDLLEFEFAKGSGAELIEEGYFEFRRFNGDLLWRSEGLEGMTLPMRTPAMGEMEFGDVDLPEDEDGRCVWVALEPRVEPDSGDEDDEEEEDDEVELPEGAIELTVFEPILLAVAVEREPMDEAIGTVLSALIVIGALAAGLGALLVYFGVRWGLRPLDTLAAQLHGVDEKSLSTHPDGSGAPLELAPVYRELGRMLSRVEATIERERSFSNAAAHELRTPLAEIRATAEVAHKWPDDERGRRALDEILAVCDELESLVESLLLISRAQKGETQGVTAAGAAKAIIAERLEKAGDVIRSKGLSVRVDIDETSPIGAPSEALEIIARNLIDNAVRYSPEGGSVTISTRAGLNGAQSFVVENGPTSLNAADVDRLFEPFWQADEARADRRHVGLGLTIVRQVAAAAGLSVRTALDGATLRIAVAPIG